MGALVVHILVVWAAIAAGLSAAALHRRRLEEPESNKYGPALTFIGSMFGLLLGLLVVTATNHYRDTRTEAQTEATAIVAMFNATLALDPAEAEPVQHRIVCYARTVIDADWTQMERGEEVEADPTIKATDALGLAVRSLPEGEPASQVVAHGREAGVARQKLLFLARPAIPTILWVLIYVGAAVLIFLIRSELTAERSASLAALACVVLMLTLVVGVLSSLDRPFSPLARIEPTALQSGLKLIAAGDERATYLRPCTT